MANKRLIAIITALMLVASSGQVAVGAYTYSQLEIIEQFILNNQWALLKAYIDDNPDVLQGSDSLAVELRNFVAAVDAAGGTISSITPPASVPSITVVETAKDTY